MVKEIWCMPHSHLDVGYTHPQPLLMELQNDYLNQAIELVEQTRNYPEEAQFKWTIEANIVLRNWLKTASSEQVDQLKRLVKEGRICITALPMHTTPCCDAREMVYMLSELKNLETTLETKINVAVSHDVNGQPWPLGQLLLDSGIDFYLTGINIHYGGIPFQRPLFFQWEMADGRKLPSYLGQQYSMFSQATFTSWHSLEKMHEGLTEHIEWMQRCGYHKDYVFLTATNPPLYDNNCPDAELPELIKRYNEEGHQWKIRFVTAQTLREKLLAEELTEVPVHRGDWTDYWNFGCASTAQETKVSRQAKSILYAAEFLECFADKSTQRYENIKTQCWEQAVLFDEHTWGSGKSITEPDSPLTYAQLIHKKEMAYKTADLAGYLMNTQMDALCENPYQSNITEGVVLVNTSGVEQTINGKITDLYRNGKRQLSAVRSKDYVSYMENEGNPENIGIVKLEPFSCKKLRFDEIEELKSQSAASYHNYHVEQEMIETPYYKVTIDEQTGQIYQIYDKQTGRNILDTSRGFALFEPVHETIDETCHPLVRYSQFEDSIECRNRDISQWNHDWVAKYEAGKMTIQEIVEDDYSISIVAVGEMEGTKGLLQKTTFYTYTSKISMEMTVKKEEVMEPEALLFVLPLKMKEGWKCSYDTAGEVVQLDEEQLGNVCRDWITVDTCVGVYDENGCVNLACPDTPMVQVGGFNFARENHRIKRDANPILAAWPMNNYWTTNFAASQPGVATFKYELWIHDDYLPKTILTDGMRTRRPITIGAAVQAKSEEWKFVECQGEPVILNLYPSANENGVIAVVKNVTEEKETLRIRLVNLEIKEAKIITPQEEVIENLSAQDGWVEISMPPRALRLVRLTKINQN